MQTTLHHNKSRVYDVITGRTLKCQNYFLSSWRRMIDCFIEFEDFDLKLLENPEELFTRYNTHSDFYSRLKSLTTLYYVTVRTPTTIITDQQMWISLILSRQLTHQCVSPSSTEETFLQYFLVIRFRITRKYRNNISLLYY